MKFININNIEELEDFKKQIKSDLSLIDLIDKYATLEDCGIAYFKNGTMEVFPFSIKKDYCFVSYDTKSQFSDNIKKKILNYNPEKIEEIKLEQFYELTKTDELAEHFSCYIKNGKFFI